MANPYFDAAYYLEQNEDVADAGYTLETAEDHYDNHGAGEGRAPNAWFAPEWYLEQNPDLEENGVTLETAFTHFINHGMLEGREPSEGVAVNRDSLSTYAAENEDLRDAFGIEDADNLTEEQQDALIQHYFQYGINEGRPGDPTGDYSLAGKLAAIEAAKENLEAEAEAFDEVVREAFDISDDDEDFDFDPETDGEEAVFYAEVAALGARALLHGERQEASDQKLQEDLDAAQKAIDDNNNSDGRIYDADGDVADEGYEGSLYTAAQLQAQADAAQSRVDADEAENGSVLELAAQLNTEIGRFIGDGGSDDTVFNGLAANVVATYQAFRDAEAEDKAEAQKAWFDAASAMLNADGSARAGDAAEGEDRYVIEWNEEGSEFDDYPALQAIAETIANRASLEYTAAAREAAFSGNFDEVLWDGQITAPTDATDDDTDEVLAPAGKALRDAEEAVAGRQESIDAVAEAQTNVELVKEAFAAYTDAQDALAAAEEALGYEIVDLAEDGPVVAAGDDAELFYFDAEDAAEEEIDEFYINGADGDDVLYLGSGYTLGEDAKNGDNNVLEVFLSEVGGNTVVQIENSKFGSDTDDFTEITLTGIALEDVSFDDGAIYFA